MLLHLYVLAQAEVGQIGVEQIQVVPDGTRMPGTAQLQGLINGGAFWALLACVGAILAGAAFWAFGSRGNNYQAVSNGKSMILGGILGSGLVGAAAALVRFFLGVGQGV